MMLLLILGLSCLTAIWSFIAFVVLGVLGDANGSTITFGMFLVFALITFITDRIYDERNGI